MFNRIQASDLQAFAMLLTSTRESLALDCKVASEQHCMFNYCELSQGGAQETHDTVGHFVFTFQTNPFV